MSTDRLAHYSADEVSVILGVLEIEDQLPEGTFFKLIPVEGWAFKKGIGRAVARWALNDKIATAELTLMQTSRHNQELSALYALDKSSKNGAGVFPAIVKDNKGASLYVTEHCFVIKLPEAEFGEEVKERTWLLYWGLDPETTVIGGN